MTPCILHEPVGNLPEGACKSKGKDPRERWSTAIVILRSHTLFLFTFVGWPIPANLFSICNLSAISLLPFQSRVRHFSCRALQSYNSPGDWARELFKPPTDSASLVVKIEKKFSYWVWAFLGGTSQAGVFLTYFGHIAWPWGAVPMGHFLDSKFNWKLGQNPRL